MNEQEQAVADAIREAEEAGEVITVTAIARKSGVSLSCIYRHPQLRAAIPDMAERDKRNVTVTVKMSPNVLDLIRQEVGEGGVKSRFIWDAVVETLADRMGVDIDDVDPVRRQARRRGNYNKRQAAKAAKETGQ